MTRRSFSWPVLVACAMGACTPAEKAVPRLSSSSAPASSALEPPVPPPPPATADAACPALEPLATKVAAAARARAAALEKEAAPAFDLAIVGAEWAGTVTAACARRPKTILLGPPDAWHTFGDFRAGQHRVTGPCLPKQPADFELPGFDSRREFIHAATIGGAILYAQDSLGLDVADVRVESIARAPAGSPAAYELRYGKVHRLYAARVVVATGAGEPNKLEEKKIKSELYEELRAASPPVIASDLDFLTYFGGTCRDKARAVDALGDVLVYGAGPTGGQIAEAIADASHHTVYFGGKRDALAALEKDMGASGRRLEKLFQGIAGDPPKLKKITAESIKEVTRVPSDGGRDRLRVELADPPLVLVVDRLVTAISQTPGTRDLLGSFARLHVSPVLGVRASPPPSLAGVPIALKVDGEEIYLAGAAMAVVVPPERPPGAGVADAGTRAGGTREARPPWGMTAEEAKAFWEKYGPYYREAITDPDAHIPTGFATTGPLLEELAERVLRK